jgi:hypothetical protein
VKYLLDSNACIGYLNGRAIGVLRRLQMLSSEASDYPQIPTYC